MKQITELAETCPRCQEDYISEELREAIHHLVNEIEGTEENKRHETNTCFTLNEGSPEFVTDLAKCKEIAKKIHKIQKEYNTYVSATVKKYKDDTKVMATILNSTQKDAIQKIKAAPSTKVYTSNVSRLSTLVSRMARRYDFSHGEWMRFTRRHYPALYRSFYRYGRHT